MSKDTEAEKAYKKLKANAPIRYCLFNLEDPWDLHYLRKDAIKNAEEISGESWEKCKHYFQIRKVKVVVL